jgi:hypothetical protein
VRDDILRGHVRLKRNYFVINTEWSGPDLGIATRDPDVKTITTLGGTKLKRNYIWALPTKEVEYH